MPSPTTKYATTITGGADWSTLSNAAGVEDGATADNFNQGPGGGGHDPSPLVTSAHGFAIPSTAVIEGIQLEAKVYGDTGSNDTYIAVGTPGKMSTVAPDFGQFWPNPAAFFTWGGPTALWGRTDWEPADINDASFGASLAAEATHATGTISIDAVRITVYWRTGPADVPKRYLYKVFSAGAYIGSLPNVISDFAVSEDINTGGSQITIECGISADTIDLPNEVLTDEAGNVLTDEFGNPLTSEGVAPIVSPGEFATNALIKNGNGIQVWEYSYYYPNGKCMFNGQMERWQAEFGGSGESDEIRILAYSDGQDLDNYLVRGYPYTYTGDITQTSSNATVNSSSAGMGAAHDWWGQTFTVGVGVTNLGAINLVLTGAADVTIHIWDSTSLTNLLGSVTQSVYAPGPTEVQFAFPATIVTTPSTQYFYTVEVPAGQSIDIAVSSTNPYAGGQLFESNYGGGGGGGYVATTGYDMWFKTFSGAGSTTATFSSLDPSTEMLPIFMDDYLARGGNIGYNLADITATGLSLDYGTNTNTIYEGIKAVLSMCPDGFYFYVDLGTNTLVLRQASTTADVVLTKGRHLEKVTFIATIENVKNVINFTGGDTGGGVNLYKQYQDATSVGLYGPKLERKTDNRVTVGGTADAIGGSALDEEKDENYQTTVTVLDRTMDTTLLKPGMMVGFNGFGTFVDNVLAQIVRVDYSPHEVQLTLGILPKRLHPEFDKVTRGLIAQQTLANPSTPS